VNLEQDDSLMFKGGSVVLNDGTYITKHDPLLKSLTNSVTLSELQGDYKFSLIKCFISAKFPIY
jgi:hypothetical protein